MYKLDLFIDEKEQNAINLRRQKEIARRSRIFDARNRTLGIDQDTLDAQIYEKKVHDDVERRRDAMISKEMIYNDKISKLLSSRQEQDIREMNRAVNAYRAQHQHSSSRKEWDLSDPESKLKDIPARISDDDPRCGVSSLQKFTGEDLNHDTRKKLQQSQFRHRIEQQIHERHENREMASEAKRASDKRALEIEQKNLMLEDLKERSSKERIIEVRNINLALAQERREREHEEKLKSQEEQITEITNNVEGPFLSEDPYHVALSHGAHARVDSYKGMGPNALQRISNEQSQQREELAQRRNDELVLDYEWSAQMNAHRTVAEKKQRMQDRDRRQLNVDIQRQNAQLAEAQRKKQEFLDRVVYTNRPTDGYYDQFNTTSR